MVHIAKQPCVVGREVNFRSHTDDAARDVFDAIETGANHHPVKEVEGVVVSLLTIHSIGMDDDDAGHCVLQLETLFPRLAQQEVATRH